jgi:hypothetical protein
MPMVSTYYYKTASGNSSVTWPANRTGFLPFYIAESTTLDRIAIRTLGTFSGSATLRLGIYNSSGGQPTTVSLDAGTVNATVAATVYTITINHTLAAGLYFLAANSQTAATSNIYFSASGSYLQMPVGTTVVSALATGWYQDVNVTSGFGTASSLVLNANTIDVWIRKT